MQPPHDPTVYARRIPVLGKVRRDAQGCFFVEEHTAVSRAVGFVCPVCGKPILVRPAVGGHLTAVCGKCRTKVAFTVDPPDGTQTQPSVPTRPSAPPSVCPARIVMGHWPHRREMALRRGITVIGRRDAACPSDISVDDPKASARSVAVAAVATPDGKGGERFEYRLQVLHATNPVFVNGIVLSPGGTVRLANGTVLRLGDTELRLKI